MDVQKTLPFVINYYNTVANLQSDQISLLTKAKNEFFNNFEALSNGRLYVHKSLAPYYTYELLNKFDSHMSAVTFNDLEFWKSERGKEYLERTTRYKGFSKSRVINRIFIVSDKEMNNDKIKNDLVKTLNQQFMHNIGLGIVFYEDLDDNNIKNGINDFNIQYHQKYKGEKPYVKAALDFALFDKNQAVTFFEGSRKESKRFMTLFASKNYKHKNDEIISEQRKAWVKLICECWIVTENFSEKIHVTLTTPEKKIVENLTGKYYNIINETIKVKGETKMFPNIIKDKNEIPEKLEIAYKNHLDRRKHKYK